MEISIHLPHTFYFFKSTGSGASTVASSLETVIFRGRAKSNAETVAEQKDSCEGVSSNSSKGINVFFQSTCLFVLRFLKQQL